MTITATTDFAVCYMFAVCFVGLLYGIPLTYGIKNTPLSIGASLSYKGRKVLYGFRFCSDSNAIFGEYG